MKKSHQVHMLPTDRESYLGLTRSKQGNLLLFSLPPTNHKNFNPQHLYITSDEKPRMGDWQLNTKIGTVTKSLGTIVVHGDDVTRDERKIIATTNPELWTVHKKQVVRNPVTGKEEEIILYSSEGIAKIDKSFIEEYVKRQGDIKEVMLEVEIVGDISMSYDEFHQERLKLNSDGTVIWSLPEDKLAKSLRLLDEFIRENPEDVARIGKEFAKMHIEGASVTEILDYTAVNDILNYMHEGKYYDTNPTFYQYVADFLMSDKRDRLKKMYTREEFKQGVVKALERNNLFYKWQVLEWFDKTYPE